MPAKAGIQTSLKFLDSDSPPLSRGLVGMTTELFNRFWGRHTSEPDKGIEIFRFICKIKS